MARRKIIPLDSIPPSQKDLCVNCFYCFFPTEPRRKTKAVVGVEVVGNYDVISYFGACGNHAEILPLNDDVNKIN